MPPESALPDDRERFRHMLEAAEDAISFVKGRTRADLDHDRLLLRGLVQSVQVIGEAAARVSDEHRKQIDLPWAKIVGMRHILAHAYFRIDEDVIWKVVTERMPELAEKLKTALANWPE